jgi:hypothetical protein
MSGNQQDVLIVLIRQTQRAQEDAKGTGVYIQNEARKPHKPLQGLDKNPGQYWTEPLIDTMTLGSSFLPPLPSSALGSSWFFSV